MPLDRAQGRMAVPDDMSAFSTMSFWKSDLVVIIDDTMFDEDSLSAASPPSPGSGATSCDPGTTVSFVGQGRSCVTAEEASDIVEAILAKADLSCVALSGNTFGREAMCAIATALSTRKHLQHALLSDVFTGQREMAIYPVSSYHIENVPPLIWWLAILGLHNPMPLPPPKSLAALGDAFLGPGTLTVCFASARLSFLFWAAARV